MPRVEPLEMFPTPPRFRSADPEAVGHPFGPCARAFDVGPRIGFRTAEDMDSFERGTTARNVLQAPISSVQSRVWRQPRLS